MKGSFTIEVSPNGSSIKIEVDNVMGVKCVDASTVFTDLGKVEHTEKKMEYFSETHDQVLVGE